MTRTLVPASALTEVTWTKSARSASVANCVQAGPFDGGIVVRNSNDPEAGGLSFTPAEWTAFIEGTKDGDFDHLI